MRIAIVTETFPPQINGVSRTLSRLVDHLHQRGHELLVVHPYYDGETYSGADGAEIKVVTLKAWPLPFYREVLVPRPPFGAYKKAIDAFKPDLVHIATEGWLGLSALRFCRRRGYQVVSSYHTNFDAYAGHYRLKWAMPLVRAYLRWFHNRTLATFVPSATIIDALKATGFERLRLWPRGVDGDLFRPDRPGAAEVRARFGIAQGATVIGHCGRLAAEKNIGYLGQALAGVLKRNAGCHVLIIGDGPQRQSLEKLLANEPGAEGRVHFTGYLTGNALADAYAAMNMFAFASRTETFGNVILEAMASGLPVVALAEGGPVDVVQDGRTGRLLGAEEVPEAMSAVLLGWAEAAGLRQTLATEARSYAESQTWYEIMGRLENDYRAIVTHD